MYKTIIIISLLLINISLFAQNIDFENSEILFEHPRPSDSGLNYPFIPLDYNSDGFPDFIGATFNEQFIYKGAENNNFEQIDIYQGFAHRPLKVMDFDNDGKEDIIMEKYINIYESDNSFFFLNPDINFQETIIEVADFNNDGLNDLLTHKEITFANDELIIQYNQGNNQFSSEIIYNKYDYEDVEIGDIDNDGDIDIAVILKFESIPIVVLYNQDLLFEEQEIPHQFDIGSTTLKLHDLDLDNDLDIITLGTFDDIYILENVDNYTNDNTFIQIDQTDILYFNMADLNNDAKQDIVTVTSTSEGFKINVLEGIGNFEFTSPAEIETFSDSDFIGYPNFNYVANNLSFYDFDLDGLLDIIYTDGFDTPNQIKLLKNNSTIVSTQADIFTSNSFLVFPNPAQDYLEIKGKGKDDPNNVKYEIRSICGKRCLIAQSSENKIDISSLASGVYILKSNEINLLERFVKL